MEEPREEESFFELNELPLSEPKELSLPEELSEEEGELTFSWLEVSFEELESPTEILPPVHPRRLRETSVRNTNLDFFISFKPFRKT